MFEHETEKRCVSCYERKNTAYAVNKGAEFRGRLEGRMENGVKNLIGNESIPETFPCFHPAIRIEFPDLLTRLL